MRFFRRFVSKSSLPRLALAVMIIANLLVALFIYKDFGYSWDEPLFYQYGDAIGYAYSIPARLSPGYDIEKAYGPSAADHKIYGPAYLLLGQSVRSFLRLFFGEQNWDLWRLVNFLCFQFGVVMVYRLARRWLDGWAALAAAAFFCYQPMLWGMAFINPKDMPFLVFFTAALVVGFYMVDRLSHGKPDGAVVVGSDKPGMDLKAKLLRIRWLWWFFLILSLVGVILLYSDPMDRWIVRFIRFGYQAPSGNLLHKVFMRLAPGALSTPMEAYTNQALELFFRLQPTLAIFLGLLALFWGALLILPYFPQYLSRLDAWITARFAWPKWRLQGKSEARQLLKRSLLASMIPAAVLGGVSSIRILGPAAGIIVFFHFLLRKEKRYWVSFGLYAVLAFVVSLATWPYLWVNPPGRFIEVLAHMANNPQILSVLFAGKLITTDQMPGSYLPVMLTTTLTEPVWLLVGVGLLLLIVKYWKGLPEKISLILVLAWFVLPVLYVLWRRPPMYDGFRHFLFILPPVFILLGFTFQYLYRRIAMPWISAGFTILMLLPGIWGIWQTHPYEYAYYNLFLGGISGAYRQYETDYWLTCYKELLGQMDEKSTGRLFVLRQPSNAQLYAPAGLEVLRFEPDDDQTQSGDYLLLTTRANVDQLYYPQAPVRYQVEKDGAVLCLIKEIP
jgi:hypothetical protein